MTISVQRLKVGQNLWGHSPKICVVVCASLSDPLPYIFSTLPQTCRKIRSSKLDKTSGGTLRKSRWECASHFLTLCHIYSPHQCRPDPNLGSSKIPTQFWTRVGKPYTISDQNSSTWVTEYRSHLRCSGQNIVFTHQGICYRVARKEVNTHRNTVCLVWNL